jgi:nickel-dependent lactate racemase
MAIGIGSPDAILADEQVAAIVAQALDDARWDGKRVLVLVPDLTRTAPIPLMFRIVYRALADRVAALDFMVALGTHPPLPDEKLYELMGITPEEHRANYSKAKFLNHRWKDPGALVSIGTLSESEVEEISGGLFRMSVNLEVNRAVTEYDHILIVGPVFPHEVVGFSGGNKYLFPGIAGQEIIDFFHWLGATITNPMIIGHKYTPVRAVVDLAASKVPAERSCFAMVVKEQGLAGLYFGTPEDAWSAAADLSAQLHVTYIDNPFKLVLSCAPAMYTDIWVAGKCMYKLEPVVEPGGKLIIYAPHIGVVSHTHGEVIEEIGYHVRDYFAKQWDKFKRYPWGVVAHSTHVRGIGTFEDGVERPRIDVVLATRISEAKCRQINLGYMNPDAVAVADYQGRENEGILCVPHAGEMLYRLRGPRMEHGVW